MKKYKKVAINIAFLTMFLSIGLTSNYLANFNSDSDTDFNFNLNNKRGEKYSQERQEKILNAFENNDYQAWKKIIGQNNKINNIINESSFQRFVLARTAARNGEYSKALRITEELKKGVEDKIS